MQVFTSEIGVSRALEEAGIEAEVWDWNDYLLTGRVAENAALDAFSAKRALEYELLGWDEDGLIEDDWKARNAALENAIEEGEEVRLVFGNGVRQQLQKAQVLNRLSLLPEDRRGSIRLVRGNGDWLAGFEAGEPISEAMLKSYRAAWLAFVSQDPRMMEFIASSADDERLRRAISRVLREYPSKENGLSLTECQILDTARLGVSDPRELFELCSEAEETELYIDWEFWVILERLTEGNEPLLLIEDREHFHRPPRNFAGIGFDDQCIHITNTGLSMLESTSHWVRKEMPERWIGGAKIDRSDPWLWDYALAEFAKESASLV